MSIAPLTPAPVRRHERPVASTPARGLATHGGHRTRSTDREELNARFRRFRQTEDRRLRNELIEEHRWIAVHCARRFQHRGVDLDDLIQVGQFGLLKAIERFDPDRGVSIASFAIPTVMGELRRYFRDATWALKVPRRYKDLHVAVGAATEFLSSQYGRPPTPADIAEHLDVTVDDVLEALEAGVAYRAGTFTWTGDDDEQTRESTVLQVEDREFERCDDALLVDELLSALPPRERMIVELRFYDELSQSEIAERIGVSQVHVSRLLRSSLSTMHDAAPAA